MHSLAETMKEACLKAVTVHHVKKIPKTTKQYNTLFSSYVLAN